MHRGWTQIDYQNKHYNINQRDEETQDDRGRDGGTNFILRIKEQETRLNLHEQVVLSINIATCLIIHLLILEWFSLDINVL